MRLIGPEDQPTPEYRAMQPFSQVPVLQDGDLTLFESGAIVLYIGARSDALMPADEAGRARATTWLLAALNTVEGHVSQLALIDLFNPDQEWARLRRPDAEQALRQRLEQLSACLGERAYLEDRFTVGDLMMTTVLRALRHTGIVADYPNLQAYQLRNQARPAFERALAAQLAAFKANS